MIKRIEKRLASWQDIFIKGGVNEYTVEHSHIFHFIVTRPSKCYRGDGKTLEGFLMG